MLQNVLRTQVAAWFSNPECPALPLTSYIRAKGFLREPQIQAIETYLYLKIAGEDKPLAELFAEGFFTTRIDLDAEPIPQTTRTFLAQNDAARALYTFATANEKATGALRRHIASHPGDVDYNAAIRKIFYDVPYADYLFSLPMGAGKTFLMAAIIYIDLYFATYHPTQKAFARNFLILAPSGLKSSIIPSLRTIEAFDPSWVIDEPAASALKKMLRFEVLDAAKTGKKSNKARNPNAQKVASYQPFEDLTGLVMVVNAEKVILEKLKQDPEGRIFTEGDEAAKAANELRDLIGKIQGLQIHIDEVHHAATDDIKLRQVVSQWHAAGNVNSVLGYSGTPYLSKPEPIPLGEGFTLKFGQITNTVYYYPLARAVQSFLKKPDIRSISGLSSLDIVRKGTRDFLQEYGSKQYSNGTTAKLAIYAGGIARAEEEIFPLLTNELGVPKEDILVYHGGNDKYKLATNAEERWRTLDSPFNHTRIIVLVQIGKEGWDCRSLTGVILSQKGDCPKNMVLQTACRCLREIEPGTSSTALIRLNEDNYTTLDAQLREEQHTSIEALNKAGKGGEDDTVPRIARVDYLKLPTVKMYQLKVHYTDELPETETRTPEKLESIRTDKALMERTGAETTRTLGSRVLDTKTIYISGSDLASFHEWLAAIRREGFSFPAHDAIVAHTDILSKIFEAITFVEGGDRYYNNLLPQEAIRTGIRNAFQRHTDYQTREELLSEECRLLVVAKLNPVADSEKLYPAEQEVKTILDLDARGLHGDHATAQAEQDYERTKKLLTDQGLGHMIAGIPHPEPSPAIAAKDRAFHYVPYEFRQSGLEQRFYTAAITDSLVKSKGLELYFNGEGHLTEFRIRCYEKTGAGSWKPIGLYTPDFLLLSRADDGSIHKAVIIETKGKGFGDQDAFRKRRKFVEEHFLKMNNEQFGYPRFDYLYLSDEDEGSHMSMLSRKVGAFFS